jgi:hypothetical protein
MWDWLLWEWVNREPNLSLFLNARGQKAVMASPARIEGVVVTQSTTERTFRLDGKVFVDCSGDGQVAADAGAEFMLGRESRHEFGESRARDKGDDMTLCPSLLMSAHDTGHPVPYMPPPWAHTYAADEDLPMRPHPYIGRGYWWMEYGGTLDPIEDAERIRDELMRIAFGVWDHIKNRGEHGAETYALDWVGTVLGKRESRRFVGDHILVQDDVEGQRLFPDRVAYCGWGLDHLHPPEGVYSKDPPGNWPQQLYLMSTYRRWYPYGTIVKSLYNDPPAHWPDFLAPLRGLASVPFRCLYSRNIENLMFAGRNISATHIAFGSTRVQGTCAVMGQAVGTAAALCVQRGVSPRLLAQEHIGDLQQRLLKDDCYIIGLRNQDPGDLALRATAAASSSSALETVEAERWLPLEWGRGQMISFSSPRIDVVSLLLRSTQDEASDVQATLLRGDRLDDFQTQEVIATATARVAAHGEAWVDFRFDVDIDPRYPHWIRLDPLPEMSWAYTANEVIGAQRAEWYDLLESWYPVRGTHCFRTLPLSRPYGAVNVISGMSRAEDGPNLWVSDAGQPLPQWIDLTLPEPREIDAVYLTFDTNLDVAVKEKPDPSSKRGYQLANLKGAPKSGPAPECVRDYRVLVHDGTVYQEAVRVEDNYQRRRIHRFAPVMVHKVKLLVEATNGAPEARVYEIRLYRESDAGGAE